MKIEIVTYGIRYAVRRTRGWWIFKSVDYNDLYTPRLWWNINESAMSDTWCWSDDIVCVRKAYTLAKANMEKKDAVGKNAPRVLSSLEKELYDIKY